MTFRLDEIIENLRENIAKVLNEVEFWNFGQICTKETRINLKLIKVIKNYLIIIVEVVKTYKLS